MVANDPYSLLNEMQFTAYRLVMLPSSLLWHLKQKSVAESILSVLGSKFLIEHLPSIEPMAHPFPSAKHASDVVGYLSCDTVTPRGL